MIPELKIGLLKRHLTDIEGSYINLSFKNYYKLLRGHLINNNVKYSNVKLLRHNDDLKTILTGHGKFDKTMPSLEYKPLDVKIHFFIQFEETPERIRPIRYSITYYKDEVNQFRFDKEEAKNDYSHPNCHLTIGGLREPRYPTPCIDLLYFLFFIEEFK